MDDRKLGENKFIDDVKLYINSNYSNADLFVESIAEYFKLTDKNLSRNFKKQTGETVSDYIRKIRIDNACILLRDSNLSISEVGKKVGFWSDSTFRRTFKQQMGINALEYKNDKI
jgi:AraC-like DNA-binding protein